MLERAGFGDAEGLGRELAVLGSEDRAQLGGVPDVELSLFALAVGVQRGREAALAGTQLAQHPVEGLRRHPAGQRRPGATPQVQVDPGEQRVVVEHLLEVRHDPVRVHRVPGEPAAQLVVHAAAGHGLAGVGGHPQRDGVAGPLVVTEQELTHHRRRELRRGTEPARRGVVPAVELRHRRLRYLAEPQLLGTVPGAQGLGGGGRVLGQGGGDLLGPVRHVAALALPGPRDVQHQLPELVAREVGAAEERLAPAGHEHRHRPAALARHRLRRGHVDRVHVGAFLPVHLYRDHVLVEQRGGLRILERFVGHDVAPVAGGVADREHDGNVAPGGLGERLVAPGPPVDRVVRMLEQVGARRIPQPVHGSYATALARGDDPRNPPCWPGGTTPRNPPLRFAPWLRCSP